METTHVHISRTGTRRRVPAILLTAFLLALGARSAHAQATGYKIIVNPSNPTTKLSKQQVAALFLKKTDRWSTGALVQPIDLGATTATRDAFTRGVLGKSLDAVRAYWNQMVFSGRNVPPPEKSSDAEVLAYVRSVSGAIGYVSEGTETRDVKVLQVE